MKLKWPICGMSKYFSNLTVATIRPRFTNQRHHEVYAPNCDIAGMTSNDERRSEENLASDGTSGMANLISQWRERRRHNEMH